MFKNKVNINQDDTIEAVCDVDTNSFCEHDKLVFDLSVKLANDIHDLAKRHMDIWSSFDDEVPRNYIVNALVTGLLSGVCNVLGTESCPVDVLTFDFKNTLERIIEMKRNMKKEQQQNK